jgi:hypothetical protein
VHSEEATAGAATWTDPAWRGEALAWAYAELDQAGFARDGEPEQLCARLTEGGVPASLQHDDLHDANVFVSGNRHRFFDWGDASVSHPFLSLLVTLRVAGQAFGVPNGHPVLVRLRDSYLDVWRDHGSPRELREQCAVALRVGPLQRALTWHRILQGVHPDERAQWADSVPGWTAEHLEPGTLAGAPAGA